MVTRLKIELVEIYSFLKRNFNEAVIISLSTLFLMLFRYHPLGAVWQSYTVYFALLPILTILFVLRKNPLDFGLRLGNYKVWGFHLLVALPIIFVLVYFGTNTAAVQRYYGVSNFKPFEYILEKGVNLWAWEFLFRGFMLFGLKDKLKENAIIVQMVPFALLHLGNPEVETISCIVSGIYFGYLCYRTGSFWPAYLLHLFINYCTKFLSVYG